MEWFLQEVTHWEFDIPLPIQHILHECGAAYVIWYPYNTSIL